MQAYQGIELTDIARDAVMQLQENIKTIASNSSGTAFPTENLFDGMLCYRTDEKKYYTYSSTTETWDCWLAQVLKYKGSVATYADLPTNAETGDVWNVQKADKTHGIKAGDNVAWSGEAWDSLGGTCDLSEYALTADQQKDVVNASVNGATVTLIARDGTNTPLTVNDVAHATAADTATKATTADSATTAASATKASQDGQGNTISTTYAKAASLATVATSGSYNDLVDKPDAYTLPTASASVLGGVKIGSDLSIAADGVISVAHAASADTATKATTATKADTATTATSATKATQDGSGNIITATYATQTALATKAPTASPTFTGTVTAATATVSTLTVSTTLNIPGGKIYIS